jgi:hypothetical protein
MMSALCKVINNLSCSGMSRNTDYILLKFDLVGLCMTLVGSSDFLVILTDYKANLT